MFDFFMNDEVTLIKSNSEKYEKISADVQGNLIFIDDLSLPIEEGDKLIRIIPNGLNETYVVIDRGLYSGMAGIEGHYEVKVRKESMHSANNKPTNINNFYGNISNSQIQQNVNNSSQVMSGDDGYKNKEELKKYILMLKENIEQIGLKQENLSDITNSIATIESELSQEYSKSKVINQCLATIRNVLEGVTGSLIASGLIYQLGLFTK